MRYYNQLIYIVLCVVFIASCQKRAGIVPKDGTDGEEKPVVQRKAILPVKIVYDKLTTEFFYEPKSTLLKEIKKSTGYRYLFFYTKDSLLLRFEIHKANEQIFLADYRRDSRGNLAKVTTFDLNGKVYTPTGYYTVAYNLKNKLVKIERFDGSPVLFNDKLFKFDEFGNVQGMAISRGSSNTTFNFIYDQQKGIYKNVSFGSLIFLVFDDVSFIDTDHNMAVYTSLQDPDQNKTITYEYDKEGYPEKMVVTRPKWKETHVISYEQVVVE